MKHGIVVALVMAGSLMASSRTQAQAPAPPASSSQQPAATPPQPDANPFPDDTTKIPVMPSKGTPALPPGTDSNEDESAARLPLLDDSHDPVRSPDDAAADTGAPQELNSSSDSQTGMDKILPSLEGDDQPQGKHKKLSAQVPEHQESSQEDIQVGGYYLDNKNWKAALSRFESAMVLAPDEPDVYWGLAESERHLGNLAAARGYYQKVAEYDPGSKHGKEALKALKEPEIANAKAAPPAPSQK